MDASMSGGGGDLKPRGIGEIISAAFEIYKAHWQRLMTIAAIVLVPLYFVVDLVVWLITKSAISSTTTNVTIVNGQTISIPSVNTTAIWASALVGFIGSALLVLAGFLVQAAISRGAAASVVGDVSVDEAYQYGFKRIGSFIWIAILVGVIVGIIPIVLLVLLSLIGLFVVGILILIAGWIFLGTMLALTIPALVIENKRGIEALSRSWELVKGHFWHVLGAIFVGGLIAGVVQGVIQAIFSFGGWFVQFIGHSISAVIATPFTALIAVVVYLDVRSRTENLTIDRLKQDLAAGGGGGTP